MKIDRTRRYRLIRLMDDHDTSQRDLATAIKARSHTTIGRLVRGETDSIRPDLAFAIASFFDCPVDYLFLPRPSTKSGQVEKAKKAS